VKAIILTQGGLALTGQKSAEAILAGKSSEGPNIKWGMKMVSSRNISRRQKTHTKRVYPEKKAVQLPTNQGEPNRYPVQTKGKSHGEQNNDLMEEVLSRQNMLKALRRVEQNKGAPGIDNLTIENLKPYLRQNWLSIKEQLLKGDYKPQPVLRVEIPKPNGGERLLGIPTVIDRLIQQALLQILTDIFDPGFSPFSFGFRPNRSTHDAVLKAKEYLEEGYQWVVDLDIEKFFDRINHDMLMARVARKIKDKRILKLIRLYLQSGVMVNGVKMSTQEGTPQGGPLSPLLANILLDDLDKELEKRGHKFVRYADDSNIYLKSKRAGQRVMESITNFLKVKLRLKVNLEKSAVDITDKRKFLGFNLYHYQEGIRIRIAPQTIKRFKIKICEITSRSNGQNIIKRILRLNLYLRGWIQYFSLSDTPYILKMLEGWIRRRLRMCLWKQWKNVRTKYRNLKKLGLPDWAALSLANTRKAFWHIAGDSLNSALPNAYWANLRLMSLTNRYCEIRSAL
jgi:RNA-directed DNA polymerase